MSLCEHGKYEGHCSICIENIPAEPVYTDPRVLGVDIASGKDLTVYSYQSPEPLYTIEQVVQMINATEGLYILRNNTGDDLVHPAYLDFTSDEEVISILQGKE